MLKSCHVKNIMMSITIAILFLSCNLQERESLFSIIADGRVPTSFQIIRSMDTSMGIDHNLWIHFRIAPYDLEKILNRGSYVKTKASDWTSMGTPEWWKPESLGKNSIYYLSKSTDKLTNRTSEERVIWVNKEKTEVFFAWATF